MSFVVIPESHEFFIVVLIGIFVVTVLEIDVSGVPGPITSPVVSPAVLHSSCIS